MPHYVHDERNNRVEALSKQEVYALLAEAIQEGQLPVVDQDTAFVTMIKSIVNGQAYKIGFCTQAQYNQLEAEGLIENNAYYVIIDDTTAEDLVAYIDNAIADLKANEIGAIEDDIDTLQTRVTQQGGYISDLQVDVARIKLAQVTGSFVWDRTDNTGYPELLDILAIDPLAEFYFIYAPNTWNVITHLQLTHEQTQASQQVTDAGYDFVYQWVNNSTIQNGRVPNGTTIYYRYFKPFTA